MLPSMSSAAVGEVSRPVFAMRVLRAVSWASAVKALRKPVGRSFEPCVQPAWRYLGARNQKAKPGGVHDDP